MLEDGKVCVSLKDNAGKQAAGAKRGKKLQPVPSAGKHATGA